MITPRKLDIKKTGVLKGGYKVKVPYRYRGRRRSFRQMSQGTRAMMILSSFIGLVLGLWVYSQVLDVVIPLVNTSTFFGSTITFIVAIIPVLGVVAAYKTAKPLFTGF